MTSTSSPIRIAWLLPTAWFYWQPSLSKLTKKFSFTKVFTGLWPGFAKGFENTLDVQPIGDRKIINIAKDTKSYGNNFTYLSPSIIFPLLRFRPHVIFSSSFGIWTLLALLLKPLGRWHIVIAYEGSSPSVDFLNNSRRLTLRRVMVRAADACITNSQRGKAYLTETLHAPTDKVFAFPYEVPDPQSLLATSSNLEEEKATHKPLLSFDPQSPIFIFIGSIIPRKGLQSLLAACLQLSRCVCSPYPGRYLGHGSA